MYLKRLELFGFKSFAEKAVLEFGPGLTAVVGPNGSGKSNVSDAIRWVLGEMSAKQLRGTRMEDVIFAGSEAKKPMGFAQVTLVLDNADGALPLDFAEVQIARRVDRAGDSEYFINQVSCRLKDVQDLFLDTGVGKENYSVVGQGKIDEILSTKAEDRRALFEEAAGIARYKARKKEAQRRLEETEQHLLRITDLITELETQVDSLAEQASRAEDYQAIYRELEGLEIGLLAAGLAGTREKLAQREASNQALQQQLGELEGRLAAAEEALEVARQLAAAKDAELGVTQTHVLEATTRLERAEARIALARQQLQSAATEAGRLHGEAEALAAKSGERTAELAQAQVERERLQAAAAAVGAELTTAEAAAGATAQQVAAQQDELEQRRSQAVHLLQEITARKSGAEATATARQEAEVRLQRAEEAVRAASAELERVEEQGRRQSERVAELTQARTAAEEDLRAAQEARRTAEEQLASLAQSGARVRERLEAAAARLGLLEEMRRELEGFQKGTRTVLLGRDKRAAWSKGVLGAVAEVLRAKPEHEKAIETALGGNIQNVITETDADAKAVIEHLKRTGGGRATFLPLNTIRANAFSDQERREITGAPGVIGIAVELVESAPRFRPALSNLLGRVVVAKDMDAALGFGKKTGFRYRTVTLDGEVLAAGGALTGGSTGGKESGLLSRERERTELTALSEQLTKEREQLKEEHVAAQGRLEGLARGQDSAQKALRAADLALSQAQGDLGRLGAEARRCGDALKRAEHEVADVQAQVAAGSDGAARLLAEAEVLGVQHASLAAEVDALAARLAGARDDASDQGRLLSDLRVRQAALQEQEAAVVDRIGRLGAEIAALDAERAAKVDAVGRVGDHRLAAEAELAAGQTQLDEASRDKQEREGELAMLQGRKLEAQTQANEREREIKSIRRQFGNASNELQSGELEATRLHLEAENLIQRLAEHWNLTPSEVEGREMPADQQPAARERSGALRERLRELGPVNIQAIADHQAAKERYAFLQQQKGDLEEAKDSLYRAIAELDKKMEHLFLENFQVIRQQFSQVYKELFDGGFADLKLMDESDLLETGIEIIAQPPGKKPQSLSLLSGGERAMTACALIFALLRVKPTPFVVLDEVEAALDEANVERVGRYLKHWSKQNQFITITHQRATMEQADALYGVTQELAGISKIVSVRLSAGEPARAAGD